MPDPTVCAYVTQRAEDGPCEHIYSEDDNPDAADFACGMEVGDEHNVEASGHPFLGRPLEVCGHPPEDHRDSINPRCMACKHHHGFVPATVVIA